MKNFEKLHNELQELKDLFSEKLNEIRSKYLTDGDGIGIILNHHWISMNNLINKMKPEGVPLNLEALDNIDFGEANIKLYNQTGDLYFRNKRKDEIAFIINWDKVKK